MRAVRKLVTVGLIIVLAAYTSAAAFALPDPPDCTGICDLAWSPVDPHLLGAVDSAGLWLLDTSAKNSAPQFFPHEAAVSLSFDPQGRSIAVASCQPDATPDDLCHGSLALFDLQTQTWKPLAAYDYPIRNVKFSPDGKYVAFEEDKISSWGIQLIDLRTNTTFFITERDFTTVIDDYAFDPQSNSIAISNGDYGTEGDVFWGISLWRLSDQTLQAYTWGDILAADLAFTGNDGEIVFVEYNTQVIFWNYNTHIISPINKPNKTVGDDLNLLSFSSDSIYLLASLLNGFLPADRTLFVWNIKSGTQIFFLDTPKGSFTNLIAINPTGDTIAYSSTADAAKIAHVWERSTDTTRDVTLVQTGG